MSEAKTPSKASVIFDKIKALFAEPAASEQAPADERKQYATVEGVALMIDRLEVGGSVQTADGTPAPAGPHALEDGTIVTVDEAGVILSVEVPQVEQSEETVDEAKNAKIAELERELAALKGQGAAFEAKFSAQETKYAAEQAKQTAIMEQVLAFMAEVANEPAAAPIHPPAGTPEPTNKREKALNIIHAGREAAEAKAGI